MAASLRGGAVVGICLMAIVVMGCIGAQAQLQLSTNLTTQFYDTSCPQVFDIVEAEVQAAVAVEPRLAASLIRLHFHDCFVQGCDGSLLLNNTPGNVDSEQFALANINSVRGFPTIDAIKAKLEAACPQTVSCADILAIASRDSAVQVGLSPSYAVFLGRRDSLKANLTAANTTALPSPFMNYAALKQNFANAGLDEVDLVTLSGGHTIGRVNCLIVNNTRISQNTAVGFNPVFHQQTLDKCRALLANRSSQSEQVFVNLDPVTPDFFDNWYYKNLLNGVSNLISDQTLFSTIGGISQPLVAKYAFDPASFAAQFALSTIKMGNIQPLLGDEGEIRLHCAFANNATAPSPAPAPSAPSLIAVE